MDDDLILKNPAKKARPQEPGKSGARRLAGDDVETLLHAVEGTRFHGVVLLGLTTGMRRQEILALRWSDVNLETGVVTVQRAFAYAYGKQYEKAPKSERHRTVTLPPEAVEFLRAHRLAQLERKMALGPKWQEHGLVFPRRDGAPQRLTAYSSSFADFIRDKNLPHATTHMLRHTSASFQVENGVPLTVVAERLGHSKIGVTADFYSHMTPAADVKAAQTLSGLVRRSNRA